jgi:hypothetical protein
LCNGLGLDVHKDVIAAEPHLPGGVVEHDLHNGCTTPKDSPQPWQLRSDVNDAAAV